MRLVTKHPNGRLGKLRRNRDRDNRLVEHLIYELEGAFAARRPQDASWIEARRQYASIPKTAVRNQPIPNAPNIEFPLGGIISDSLYAQATDTLYSASPILTARELDSQWEDHAKAIQKFTNWMAANELGLRFATDNAFQDDVQLGTGVLYIPYVKDVRSTDRERIVYESPRVLPIPAEDFLVPGGSRGDHQQDRFAALRFWYTKGEFNTQARSNKWDVGDGVMPTAQIDQVRLQHEQIARTSSIQTWREMYEVINVWVYFDYYDDGVDLDLLCVFDRASRRILDLGFNEYDTRPIETMRYQIRPHLFWGLGVMEMIQPFQDAATEIINHYLCNMLLANARVWAARHGTFEDFQKVWPSKVVGVESTDDIKELRMSDVYASGLMGLDKVIQAAERRVGVTGDLTSGNPATRVLGTRTPGITTMSALQAVNRRFSPAFDGMRLNTAAAVRQALWRYAERVRANDPRVKRHINRVMGERDGALVIDLLRQDDFEQAVSVEFTAVSASVNREADRQNAMLLMQSLGTYYERIMQMATMLDQQAQQPMPLTTSVARKVIKSVDYSMDAFLRTFDQVRNPGRLLVDLTDELDQAEETAVVAAEQQQQGEILGSIIQGVMGGGVPAGGPGGPDALATLPE